MPPEAHSYAMTLVGLGCLVTQQLCDLQFVADGVFYAELNELLTRELAQDGYSGAEVRVTPMRTEIIIRATLPQRVLGKHICCGKGPWRGSLKRAVAHVSLALSSGVVHLAAGTLRCYVEANRRVVFWSEPAVGSSMQ